MQNAGKRVLWKSSRKNWPCNSSPIVKTVPWLLSDSRDSLWVHVIKHNQGRERRTRNWGERIRVHACPWWDIEGSCTHSQARTSLPDLSTPAGHTDGFQELHQTRPHITRVMPCQCHELQTCQCGVYKNAQCAYSHRAHSIIWKVRAAGPLRQEETFFTSSTNNWQLLVKFTAHDFLLDRTAGATLLPCIWLRSCV